MSESRQIPVKRIIFKEIQEGDRRKLEAASNDTRTGGGARDLRFSPYFEYKPIFERMFSLSETEILLGQFNWYEGDNLISKEAFFHPPTTARKNEGRIANIDKCLPGNLIPDETEGRVFLLLIQDSEGKVWPSFATEESLLNEWNEDVKNLLLNCDEQKKRQNKSTTGFVDFEYGGEFCNHV